MGGPLVILICLNQHRCSLFLRWGLIRNINLGTSKRLKTKSVKNILLCCSASSFTTNLTSMLKAVQRMPYTPRTRTYRATPTGTSYQTHKIQEVPRENFLFTEKIFHEAHQDITKAPWRNLEMNAAFSWKQIDHNECSYLSGWTQISTILTPINVSCQQVFLKIPIFTHTNCCGFSWLYSLTELISIFSWKKDGESSSGKKIAAISLSSNLHYVYFKISVIFTIDNAQIAKQTMQGLCLFSYTFVLQRYQVSSLTLLIQARWKFLMKWQTFPITIIHSLWSDDRLLIGRTGDDFWEPGHKLACFRRGLFNLEIVPPPKGIKRKIFFERQLKRSQKPQGQQKLLPTQLENFIWKGFQKHSEKEKGEGKRTFLFKSRILKAIFLPLPTPIFQEEQSHSYLFKAAAALVAWAPTARQGSKLHWMPSSLFSTAFWEEPIILVSMRKSTLEHVYLASFLPPNNGSIF